MASWASWSNPRSRWSAPRPRPTTPHSAEAQDAALQAAPRPPGRPRPSRTAIRPIPTPCPCTWRPSHRRSPAAPTRTACMDRQPPCRRRAACGRSMNHFELRDQGPPASGPARPHRRGGRAPGLCLLDRDPLQRHFTVFRDAVLGLGSPGAADRLCVKATPNPSVLKVLGERRGADTVSEGEIRRALAAFRRTDHFLRRRQATARDRVRAGDRRQRDQHRVRASNSTSSPA